jgi:hypothetical protein
MNYFVSYRSPLPTVKTFRFVLCLAALLFCAPLAHAQEEEPPVVDTLVAPVLEAPPLSNNDEDNGVKTGTVEQIPEFRQVPDTTVQSLKNRKEFAYANDPGFWKPEPKIQEEHRKGFWEYFYDFFSADGVRIIAYFILIAFFAFVVYRIIVVNKLYLFYRSGKSKGVAQGDETDIQDINFDEKIQQAMAAGNHRMAVRYMYLKSLKLLNEKQWIRYHADGTNYEYVNQMSGRKLASEFSFLTRIYDYVWYGEFAVTQEQFDIVHKNFSHFYNAVKS